MFFYRDPEEAEKEEQARQEALAAQAAPAAPVGKVDDQTWGGEEMTTDWANEPAPGLAAPSAGLAAAQQLNRAGHTVTVFERDNKIGGLLRYGIPDFKMGKNIIDRRLEILEAEGITFKCEVEVGKTISAEEIEKEFDAVVLCTGASIKRELPIPGADLNGVTQAMDFLPHNNKAVDGQHKLQAQFHAKDRNVIVIGGGDTGSDCIGTSNRQGAKSVTNFEIMPKPEEGRTEENYGWSWKKHIKKKLPLSFLIGLLTG